MDINTLKDVQDNIDLLKDREITYYDGTWIAFKVDGDGCGSPDNSIKLNNKLFNVLKDCEYLFKESHTVSHRSVTHFKFADGFYKNADIMTPDMDSLLLDLMKDFHNQKFTSISKIIDYAREKGYETSWNDYHYDFGSYWGGDRYCSVILFKRNKARAGIVYNACGRTQLFKKNFIYRTFVRYHRIINGMSWLNYKDVPYEWIEDGSGTGKRYRKLYVVDDFWKAVPKLQPYTDESLDKLVEEKRKELCKK